MRKRALGAVLSVALSGAWFGCGTGGNTDSGAGASSGFGAGGTGAGAAAGGSSGDSGGGAVGGSGAGGSAAGGGTGGNGAGPSDSGLPDVQFRYDGTVEEKEACAAVTLEAELIPLDLYVVLDRSGSMVNPSLGPLRWPPVRDALNQFYQSPQSQSIGIALTMFAHPTASQCTPLTYQTPLVGMAPLPGNASGHALTLQNTMNQYAPVLGIGTPTQSAITGAITFAKNYKNSNPGRTVALVLATDGLPGASGCGGETAAGVQSAIANGFNNQPAIRTFVIGIDPNTEMSTNLNNWATAGNGQFFNVGTAGGSAQFLQAMQNIQGALLGCTFSVPQPEAGVIEPDEVDVIYTPGAGAPVPLTRVVNAAACSGPGWYYDNNTNPTVIELCPASCSTVQADPNGKINIELGCLGS